MAFGWKTRTALVGAAAAVMFSVMAASPASAATRTMNATLENSSDCTLGLSSGSPAGSGSWTIAPPSTIPPGAEPSFGVRTDLGRFSSTSGYVEYLTRDCTYPSLNGTLVHLDWTLWGGGLSNISYYNGWTSHAALSAGLMTEYWGSSPEFIVMPTLT
ncbi:hypothetical protein [Actinocorallia populi]|uniref:hypothetical protein n=1 Tax=Actinocorallia populi TaxID=2079200 RepID=UPI000D096F7C|nr:hypothetical protein [Actinocorallia populi]